MRKAKWYYLDFTEKTIYSSHLLGKRDLTLVLCEGLYLKSGGGFFVENRRIFNLVTNQYPYAAAL